MSPNQLFFLLLFFVCLLLLVLRMIVTHQLREVYAVVWILVTLLVPVSAVSYPLLVGICGYLGIASPFSFAIFIGLVISYGLLLHFSMLNSGAQRTLKNAIQKIALLEGELATLAESVNELKREQGCIDE